MKSIDIFPWNNNFNTGITIIDEQHRRLVELLNQLASHLAFQSDLPELNVIFDQLADYTVYHFQTEEKIWHKNLPEDSLESAHKNVHASFIHKVLELKTDINTKPSDEVIEDILSFLTRWLALHILESDRYMAMVTLAIQAGQPIVSAKKQADEQMQGSTKALIDVILSIYQSLSTNALYLMRKISEQTSLESALSESEKKLQLFIKHAPAALAMFDKQMHYIAVSQRWLSDFGITGNNITGQSHYDLFPEISERWKSVHRRGLNGEVLSEECDRFERDDGSIQWVKWEVRPWRDVSDEIGGIIIFSEDITQKQQAKAHIEQLAYFDPLTGLPNRRLLLDRLNHALTTNRRTGQQGALLFLDLDHFKTINDTLGHDMGDLLLQQVATRLTTSVREDDTIARLGGDEFVVLLENLSEQSFEAAAQAQDVAEKILFTLNQPYQLDTNTYHSTPSIGAAVFSGHEQLAEELLKQSNIAMYQAKAHGRNTLRFFDPKMQEAITVRVDMENELRKAIEDNQFQLHYQIQVGSNGQAFGAEALIRWIHPERGMISPFNFIPLAEETGLILPIGQWVLDTACAQLKTWQQNSLAQGLILAVNVSAKQFHQDDFVAQVLATIARHDINPTRLKLELTESMLVDNISDIITKMDALSKIGICFSLDDFGTGYSSLQYLKKLPLHQLKIDQSFVRDIISDSSDRAIVRTIITMAHGLDINVIAEGVETAEQRQFLLDSGCTYYQGYLFSKPVPIDEFEALLKKG